MYLTTIKIIPGRKLRQVVNMSKPEWVFLDREVKFR